MQFMYHGRIFNIMPYLDVEIYGEISRYTSVGINVRDSMGFVTNVCWSKMAVYECFSPIYYMALRNGYSGRN